MNATKLMIIAKRYGAIGPGSRSASGETMTTITVDHEVVAAGQMAATAFGVDYLRLRVPEVRCATTG